MRRPIKEIKFNVNLITSDGSNLTRIIDAPTQDIALRRAQQAFKGLQFVNVSVTALDQQATPQPSQQPPSAQLPVQPKQLQQLQPPLQPGQQFQQQQENINFQKISYPYEITLPMRFRRLLRECSPSKVNENFGQYTTRIENTKQMNQLINRLRMNKDIDGVNILLNGIRSSIP
jgi:hypothetical protein